MGEQPEIVEIGAAEALTLGTMGMTADKCDCVLVPEAQLPDVEEPARPQSWDAWPETAGHHQPSR